MTVPSPAPGTTPVAPSQFEGDPWGGNPSPLSLRNLGVVLFLFVAVLALVAAVVHPWVAHVERMRAHQAERSPGPIAGEAPGMERVWRRAPVLAEAGPERARNAADGAELVAIPRGVFRMGRDDGPVLERPAHDVELDAYWIDLAPVSVARYAAFLAATADAGAAGEHRHPSEPAGKDRAPAEWEEQRRGAPEVAVTGVDWFDAYAYASWAGLRLPTEAEWERARAALSGSSALWEWCYDGFDGGYYARSPRRSPLGPSAYVERVVRRAVRGESSLDSSRHRRAPGVRARELGFRCVGAYSP